MANRIQGTTGLVGLIGNPLKHSRSPHMHNSAFERLGLDYVYLCFEVPEDGLADSMRALKTFNAIGSNITFPFKQEVLQYLDHIDKAAHMIGSVNTVKIDPMTKETTGYNTDGLGFIASIDEKKISFRGNKVVLTGVGGAGRAIAINLALNNVRELCIREINKELAAEVKGIIEEHCPDVNVRIISDDDATLKEELINTALFVDATPLGMEGDNEDKCSVKSADVFNEHVFVYHIVYAPSETKLMKLAKKAGCQTSNGITMMIWQGAIAFKIFTGCDMPQDYVRQELFSK